MNQYLEKQKESWDRLLKEKITEIIEIELPLVDFEVNINSLLNESSQLVKYYIRMSFNTQITEEKSQVIGFRSPSSWWQMLKFQYAPEWFKKLYPIHFSLQEKTAVFTRRGVKPKTFEPITYHEEVKLL